jgi:hypothetical protein
MRMEQITRQWTVDDVPVLRDDGNRYEVLNGEARRDAGCCVPPSAGSARALPVG